MSIALLPYTVNETTLVPQATQPVGESAARKPARLASLDAYRGFILLAMVAGDLDLTEAMRHYCSDTWLGAFLAFHTEHVAWVGCSFWDLIQPSFLFMVGMSLPYSYARRRRLGESEARIFAHAALRAAIFVLPIVLFSYLAATMSARSSAHDNFGFTHVLVQIGLGYVGVHLLRGRPALVQAGAVLGILVGYTLLFALFPATDSEMLSAETSANFTGWFAHWDEHTNAAAVFDRCFLNLFPRPEPFLAASGGYQTLNFVPSLATMILGLMAGEWLRKPRSVAVKFWGMLLAGAACLLLGWLAGEFICPIVKRIWTPSWSLYSAGWAFVLLAGFFGIIDLKGYRRWAFPLVVAGTNCLFLYILSQILKGFFEIDSSKFNSLAVVKSSLGFVGLWVVCLWMHRRGLFLRL